MSRVMGGYAIVYAFFVDKTMFSVEPGSFSLFKTFFYFVIMMSGGIIRIKKYNMKKNINIQKYRFFLLIIMLLSFLLWCSVWGTVNILHRAYNLQFLVHVSVYIFTMAILLFARTYNGDARKNKWLDLISDSTLEIYFVQITFYEYFLSWTFPINVVLFYLIVFSGGITFHIAEKYLEYRIKSIS